MQAVPDEARAPSPQALLTAEDVAGILSVREQYVYSLARQGAIPHIKLGKYVRFRAAAVEAWLASQEESRG